jgi:hypothetical protein
VADLSFPDTCCPGTFVAPALFPHWYLPALDDRVSLCEGVQSRLPHGNAGEAKGDETMIAGPDVREMLTEIRCRVSMEENHSFRVSSVARSGYQRCGDAADL